MERLTKHGKTVHENKVCCTHFYSWECKERRGNCTNNCPWEEAAWSRLAAYEDSGLAPERVQELGRADAEGRVVVLKEKYTQLDGEEALRKAMYTVGMTNNPTNRYIADAVAEKLVRDEAVLKADTKEGL